MIMNAIKNLKYSINKSDNIYLHKIAQNYPNIKIYGDEQQSIDEIIQSLIIQCNRKMTDKLDNKTFF